MPTPGEEVLRRSALNALNRLKRLGSGRLKKAAGEKSAPERTPMLSQVATIIKRIRMTAKPVEPGNSAALKHATAPLGPSLVRRVTDLAAQRKALRTQRIEKAHSLRQVRAATSHVTPGTLSQALGTQDQPWEKISRALLRGCLGGAP